MFAKRVRKQALTFLARKQASMFASRARKQALTFLAREQALTLRAARVSKRLRSLNTPPFIK